MNSPAQQPQAGWYDDSTTPNVLRWWDGTAWTEHTSPTVAPIAAPTAAPQLTQVQSGPSGLAPRTGERFRSPVLASRVALAMLAFIALVDLVAIPTRGTPSASDSIDGVWAIAMLATIVAFIVWFHRMYANLPALGAGPLRYSTGWAIGSWFVPFLNYWRPVKMACDISRGSDPDAPSQLGADWSSRPYDQMIAVWWSLWVGVNVSWNALSASTGGEQVSDALEAGAAVACAVVVWRLTAAQLERAHRLGVDGTGA